MYYVIFDACNPIASVMVALELYVCLSMNEIELFSFQKKKKKKKRKEKKEMSEKNILQL
jgi:hypothetical protein